MEIAIPLIALGGMYVISNQNSDNNSNGGKNKNKPNNNEQTNKKVKIDESFTNMGKKQNYLPNTDIHPQNFPTTNINQLMNTPEEYANPNVSTDKYFNQDYYQKRVQQGKTVDNKIQQIYSLSGNYLDSNQFKHNNMVPFVGGSAKSYTYNTNVTESVLDNMVGNGSQIIKKTEQAPLFKPEDNMNWTYGTPNQSDFYQSRVNPSMKSNNIKPFDTIRVGPGLNKGYSSAGTGGFNSGMDARDSWLPKTVDELRVATNPKLEYELINHEGPADARIKNVGMIGRVEKKLPESFYVNSQDRWLVTTGAHKGETLRSIQETGNVKRNEVDVNYQGPAGNGDRQAGYAPTNFEPSKRTETTTCDVPHSTAVGRGPIDDGHNNIKNHKIYSNNRSTMKQPDSIRSGFSGAIGAVISPLMDILRPSRKEETINNVRIYGEAGTTVSQSYVINNNEKTPTTIKESTIYSPNFYINGQANSTYINNNTKLDFTQRDTTTTSYTGISGGSGAQYGSMSYESAYNQYNNDIKSQTIHNRINQGGTQIFNQQNNICMSKQDSDSYNCRVNTPSLVVSMPPSKQHFGKLNEPQVYNQSIQTDRLTPDILTAFRENPYTHSLSSAV